MKSEAARNNPEVPMQRMKAMNSVISNGSQGTNQHNTMSDDRQEDGIANTVRPLAVCHPTSLCNIYLKVMTLNILIRIIYITVPQLGQTIESSVWTRGQITGIHSIHNQV